LTLDIPKIKTTSQYKSSGVLILLQASGSGDYWGEYGMVYEVKEIILINT
jgi:hypothetical protein